MGKPTAKHSSKQRKGEVSLQPNKANAIYTRKGYTYSQTQLQAKQRVSIPEGGKSTAKQN
jgi:hypothetical protein